MPGTETIRRVTKMLMKIQNFAVKQVLTEANHFAGLCRRNPVDHSKHLIVVLHDVFLNIRAQ